MSSFSNIAAVRHVWRPVSVVAGWASGVLAVACLAAAVVLGGATAAVQLAGQGVADASGVWIMVAELVVVGAVLAALAYGCFSASDETHGESFAPMHTPPA